MLSFWEARSFIRYHYIIIGSGITGLSTAIELKHAHPDRKVLVLERGLIPAGASTRNAGFACMGSAGEMLDDLKHMSDEEVVRLFQWRKEGLSLLRNRLGDSHIGYAEHGSYELIRPSEESIIERIESLNTLLKSPRGKDIFSLATKQKIQEFGFSSAHISALIETHGEGELDTGKMMQSLIYLAMEKGVEIKTGAPVSGYVEDDQGVRVTIPDAVSGGDYTVFGAVLIVCTNAFTKTFVNEEEVVPGRGQVLVTEPVAGLKFRGIFHMDMGYYYFREVDGRVLFGGGRNLDFAAETTTAFGLNDAIQADLEEKMRTIILPGQPFRIARRWSGIMAFGSQKFPIIRQISPAVFGAYRLGGMGVALGSKVARELTDLIIRSEKPL